MSAAQDSGRFCACGCGASIANMKPAVKLAPACALSRQLERRHHTNRMRNRRGKENVVKSLHHRQVVVDNRGEVVKNPRQRPCKSCAGMPSARAIGRCNEMYERIAVIPPYTGETEPHPVCRGCGDAWAPDPPLDRPNVLGSSAGTAVRAGQLYGAQFAKGVGRPEKKWDK